MHSPLALALVCFGIVIVAMGLLTAVFQALRALGVRLARGPASEAAGEIDPELIAVIAAAAREALGVPLTIHRVHVHHEPTVEHWSRAGRMDIMVSHRVEHKR